MQGLKLSITQLNNYIKNIFDNEELLIGISVYGEVSGYKISGGNAYFDIKEEGATLSCIEFGATSEIKDGDSVLITGRLNYHVRFGKLSFVASKIEPYGMGDLYKKFLLLKEKLEAEGIFDERNKREIPKYAKCIGVVTSETGAVIHDIINVARRKNPKVDILLYPVKVQGEGAEDEISEGIAELNKISRVDVIIVARGGGSMIDLAPFNTEKVARAVFESHKPIVSGVGHETDFTLCDFASDLRAATPSVASEICVFDYYNEINNLKALENLMFERLSQKYQKCLKDQKLYLTLTLSNVGQKLADYKAIFGQKLQKITANINKVVELNRKKMELVSLAVEKNNPFAILRQGYSKLDKDNKPVLSVKNIKENDEIDNYLNDGVVVSKVIKIKEIKWHTKNH